MAYLQLWAEGSGGRQQNMGWGRIHVEKNNLQRWIDIPAAWEVHSPRRGSVWGELKQKKEVLLWGYPERTSQVRGRGSKCPDFEGTSFVDVPIHEVRQGSAILSESVRNRDTGEPGISISIDFWKFPVSVSVSESIITKIWYPTQWFWAFHLNLCYKTYLTLVSVLESESKFSLFLVSVSK